MELGLNTFKLRVFNFRIWGELVLLIEQVVWPSMSATLTLICPTKQPREDRGIDESQS